MPEVSDSIEMEKRVEPFGVTSRGECAELCSAGQTRASAPTRNAITSVLCFREKKSQIIIASHLICRILCVELTSPKCLWNRSYPGAAKEIQGRRGGESESL